MPSLPASVQAYVERIAPASVFSLKRATTASTKASSSTYDSSTYYNFPSYNRDDAESGSLTSSQDGSSYASHHSIGTTEQTINTEYKSLASDESANPQKRPSLQSKIENQSAEDDISDYNDQIIETNTKTRSLSLHWGSSSQAMSDINSTIDDICELPEGISKSDITVTIDIDDEARSSRVAELDEEDLDVEILHHNKRDSGEFSPRKQCHRKRRTFEEALRQSVLDDLRSVYTATPKAAKFVLCVVVSVLSDGTLEHTFWSGGRVGLTEIVMQWVMFDADDLQVYKRGRAVQKRDFGFGPLGLTKNEGQHYLATKLAPRATNEIIRKIGHGTHEQLMVEI